MSRYIDADNLINELSAACMPIYEKGITGILGDNSSIADIINEQPTADVHPVCVSSARTRLCQARQAPPHRTA